MNQKLFVSGLCRRIAFCFALGLAPLTTTFVAAQEVTPARVLLPTDRTVLPIPERQYPHSTVLNVRNATPPPRFEVKAHQCWLCSQVLIDERRPYERTYCPHLLLEVCHELS
jgi:hypothetical protein